MGLANDNAPVRGPRSQTMTTEFALLTRMRNTAENALYPRLRPAMTLESARPIIAQMAEELMGGFDMIHTRQPFSDCSHLRRHLMPDFRFPPWNSSSTSSTGR